MPQLQGASEGAEDTETSMAQSVKMLLPATQLSLVSPKCNPIGVRMFCEEVCNMLAHCFDANLMYIRDHKQ